MNTNRDRVRRTLNSAVPQMPEQFPRDPTPEVGPQTLVILNAWLAAMRYASASGGQP